MDKKKKEEKGKNYFSTCLTTCRFKANSNSKQYKIIKKNSSLENYKAKSSQKAETIITWLFLCSFNCIYFLHAQWNETFRKT